MNGITCQACGTQNPAEATYCTKCARKLDSETQAAVVQQRHSYLASGIDLSRVVIAAVLALVVVAVVILLVVNGM